MAAFNLSVLLNTLLVGLVGYGLMSLNWTAPILREPSPDVSSVSTLFLQPETIAPEEVAPPPAQEKPFARTSPDQPKSEEKTNERIGEHSTKATSDRAADPNAEALPSQAGVEPKEGEIETTESQYQDGEINPAATLPLLTEGLPTPPALPTPPTPLEPSPNPTPQDLLAENPTPAEPAKTEINPEIPPTETSPREPTLTEESTPPPLREKLLEGPDPVEVNVPREVGDTERPRETPERPTDQTKPDSDQPASQRVAQNPPQTPTTPRTTKNFQGNQKKTAMIGSITRHGRSALNVDDSELGRYQAAIGKAVEKEWQRNCFRHRDFITPGFLTVRFYVEPSGRIRSIKQIGEMESGEVQKGFTFSSIREADIPAMPKTLADAYADDSMEIVFRFFF